jgi:hypothetical protein
MKGKRMKKGSVSQEWPSVRLEGKEAFIEAFKVSLFRLVIPIYQWLAGLSAASGEYRSLLGGHHTLL